MNVVDTPLRCVQWRMSFWEYSGGSGVAGFAVLRDGYTFVRTIGVQFGSELTHLRISFFL